MELTKQRGFTMIELLATIIILGLLVTIVYMSARSILERGDDSYYKSQEDMILLAGKDYFADYRDKLPKEISETNYVTLETLINEKYIDPVKDKNGNDCDYKKSRVTVQKITDKDYQYYVTLLCNSYETTEDEADPVISFNPNKKTTTKSITIKMKVTDNIKVVSYRYVITKDGETYQDTDYKDYKGDITIKLTENGLYKITGYAIDTSGNKVSKTSGKYSIYEGIDCSKVRFSTSAKAKTWTNQNVTIKFDVPDNTYRVEFSKKIGNGNYNLMETFIGSSTQNIILDEDGKTTVKAVLYDADGNSCTVTTDEYYIDKTKPKCVSSGGLSSWTSENITLKGTCSDSGSGCTGDVTKVIDTDTNKTNQSPGVVKDKAGNSTTCPADQTVKVDKTAPKCTSSGGSSAWQTSSVTLKGTCSDSGSGCAGNVTKTYTSQGEWLKQSPGVVRDKVGHTTTCPANQTVRIAFLPTKPTINLNGYESGSWTNQPVKVTTSSQSFIGINRYEYSHDGWTWKNEINEFPDSWHREFFNNRSTMNFTVDWQSSYNYYMRAIDNANRASEASDMFTINIDTTSPVCTVDNSYDEYINYMMYGDRNDPNFYIEMLQRFPNLIWTADDRTLYGWCSDTGGSGCQYSYHWAVVNQTRSYSRFVNDMYDNAGNSTKCDVMIVNVDKTPPYAPYLKNIVAGDNVDKVDFSCQNNSEVSTSTITCNANVYVGEENKTSTIIIYVWDDDIGSGVRSTLQYFESNGENHSNCNWVDKDECNANFGTNPTSAVARYKTIDFVGHEGPELIINYNIIY